MKKIIFILLWIISVSPSPAEKVSVLKEISRPGFDIVIENDRLYVPEGHQIFIYSMKDYRLINKFGKKGEGPREFRGDTFLNIQPQYLLVESHGKLSYFTKKGEFIREIICPKKGGLKGITPISDNKFIGIGTPYLDPKDDTRYQTLSFYDKNFIEGESFTRTPSRFQKDGTVIFMNGTFNFKVYDGRIFVQYHGRKFKLNCFNQSGQLEFVIKNDKFKNRKVSKEDRRRAFAYLKKYMPWVYRQKERVKFPDYWGGVGTFFIDQREKKIYIITYIKRNENESLFYVYDLRGQFIDRYYLPVGDRNIWAPYPLDIEAGKMVQLRENLEREDWELHITCLK